MLCVKPSVMSFSQLARCAGMVSVTALMNAALGSAAYLREREREKERKKRMAEWHVLKPPTVITSVYTSIIS